MIETVHLFPGLHQHLLELLGTLSREDWQRPTVCKGWSVHDVASHILDTQIRLLSSFRDQSPLRPPAGDLRAWLNKLNQDWVQATRPVSPTLLVEFLTATGPELSKYFASLDPHAPAPFPVAWAGETTSLNWFDTGRHYTEYWHHQQQIRDEQWLHPVIALFLRALPHTYAKVSSAPGTTLQVTITGEAGGDWSLVRQASGWLLSDGSVPHPTADVQLSADIAWRLFTKGIRPAEAPVNLSGDPALAGVFLNTLAIMA